MRKREKNATIGCGMTWHNKLQVIYELSKEKMKRKNK